MKFEDLVKADIYEMLDIKDINGTALVKYKIGQTYNNDILAAVDKIDENVLKDVEKLSKRLKLVEIAKQQFCYDIDKLVGMFGKTVNSYAQFIRQKDSTTEVKVKFDFGDDVVKVTVKIKARNHLLDHDQKLETTYSRDFTDEASMHKLVAETMLCIM